MYIHTHTHTYIFIIYVDIHTYMHTYRQTYRHTYAHGRIQVILSDKLAREGRSPALDPMGSVTRIGIGADNFAVPNSPAMSKVVGRLRMDLAQASALPPRDCVCVCVCVCVFVCVCICVCMCMNMSLYTHISI